MSDLTDSSHEHDHGEEEDIITESRLLRKKRAHHHSTTSAASNMYFSEVDVRQELLAHVQSTEDVSSGYSSGEVLYAGHLPKLQAREGLARTGSVGPTRSRSVRITRSTIVPKKAASSVDSDVSIFIFNFCLHILMAYF